MPGEDLPYQGGFHKSFGKAVSVRQISQARVQVSEDDGQVMFGGCVHGGSVEAVLRRSRGAIPGRPLKCIRQHLASGERLSPAGRQWFLLHGCFLLGCLIQVIVSLVRFASTRWKVDIGKAE